MKLRKIVTFVVTAAAAAVCTAALLAVDAGAVKVPEGYTYTTDGGTTFNDITTLDQYLFRYGQLYDKAHNYVGPGNGELVLDASDGNATLTSVQLGYIAAKGLSSVTMQVTDNGYRYNVYLKNKNVNFFSGSNSYTNSVDFRLFADTSTRGTLKLYSGNYGSYSGHPYIIHIPGDLYGSGMFRSLLKTAAVDMSDRLRLYTYDNPDGSQKEKNIKVIYSKDADYDLSLTFGNGINNYYYTKYDKTILHLYNQSNIAAYIEQKIADLSGMTLDQAYYDSSVRSCMEDAKKYVIGKFFVWDSAANDWKKDETVYLTAADIDPHITAYFTGKDVNGNVTAGSNQHLDEIVRALIVSGENDRIIENALYSVFGWDLNSRVADELKNEIADAIVDKLINAGATVENYKTLAQYFLNEWATGEYRDLKNDIDGARAVLDSNNTKYGSDSAVIQELCAVRSLLGNDPSTKKPYSLGSIAKMIKNNSGRITSLIGAGSFTTNDLANALGGAQSTVPTAYNNYSGSTSETYVTGQAYATKSELTSYINSLNSTINDLQNQINSLKNSVNNNNTNTVSVYDWIKTTPYGDVDTFINAVTERVAQKIGSGESAYDIAVRNGFKGNETAWLNSLVGESAYEIALDNGFKGTEKAWLNSLKADGTGASSEDDKVVYIYEQKFNSAAPADADDEEVVITEGDETVSAIPLSMTTETNFNVADTKTSTTRNPSTGIVAGVLIPAGAAACIFLIKKDKRRRGRK